MVNFTRKKSQICEGKKANKWNYIASGSAQTLPRTMSAVDDLIKLCFAIPFSNKEILAILAQNQHKPPDFEETLP